ncbi:hypothetical protein HOD05_04540 [Candidatus Woesearchaeota archaeon]|jgi:hypothetical protein|nr:hypothetical protein [Candidatus Woesearchaeota archaeon]MBT4150424.1 hypothetical protein [Candidatus Woesearchaeota archaeon]MBT4247501.1 hypothetical protein [Candidatus Woesearchaeota archaeon]MBT4434460.1 hypothetical protein [Candidatus Woesearchaeota archaeon]MBT7331686.1 hypothetical protein [Candidatus Woesearchaeota archaeon]
MTHYLIRYKQGKANTSYHLFDENGLRVMQHNALHLLKSNAFNDRNIRIISKDIPLNLFERIKQNYAPNNYFLPVKGGSILEESLQDNDLTP